MKKIARILTWSGTSLVALSLLLAGGNGAAQTQPAKPTAKPAAKPASKAAPPVLAAVLEPKAIDLLKAASSRLAAAKSMKFTAVVSYEAPSRFGPPLVYTTKSDVTMQRPDKLKIVTPGDGPASEFYFDGKVMMAFAPKENLVAVGDAPPTIDDMLQYAFHSAELHFPVQRSADQRSLHSALPIGWSWPFTSASPRWSAARRRT